MLLSNGSYMLLEGRERERRVGSALVNVCVAKGGGKYMVRFEGEELLSSLCLV